MLKVGERSQDILALWKILFSSIPLYKYLFNLLSEFKHSGVRRGPFLKRLYLKNLIQFSKTLKADPRHPLLS
jgi:hypothetical protein